MRDPSHVSPGDRLSLPRRFGQRSNTCASWPAEGRKNREMEGDRKRGNPQKRRKTKRESAEEEGKKNQVIAQWMLLQNSESPMFR